MTLGLFLVVIGIAVAVWAHRTVGLVVTLVGLVLVLFGGVDIR